jgi:hypothetical protein
MNLQDFEGWIQSHGGSTDRTDGGEYRSAPTECAWGAWQAATEKAATACAAIEAASLAKWHSDLECNKYFWNGAASGAGECAAVLRGETDED